MPQVIAFFFEVYQDGIISKVVDEFVLYGPSNRNTGLQNTAG